MPWHMGDSAEQTANSSRALRWPHQLTEGHSRHRMNVTYPMTLGTKIQYKKKLAFQC